MEKPTSFILAGGQSRRMGVDKGFCKVDESEFIPLIAKSLSKISTEVILVSNLEKYQVFGLKRIEDIYPNKGPLGGIHAALSYTSTENNIILSCDIPLITTNLIQKLLIASKHHDVVQLATAQETMPLAALYKKSCLAHFANQLKKNDLKLKNALQNIDIKSILVSKNEEVYLSNINTPEELKEINHDC